MRNTEDVKSVFTRRRISCATRCSVTARTADKRASAAKNLKKRSGVAATTTTWITTTITSSTKHQWSNGGSRPPSPGTGSVGGGHGPPLRAPRCGPRPRVPPRRCRQRFIPPQRRQPLRLPCLVYRSEQFPLRPQGCCLAVCRPTTHNSHHRQCRQKGPDSHGHFSHNE